MKKINKNKESRITLIPIHTFIYSIISSFFLGISLILLVLRFKYLIYAINPYYLIGITIICIGLLCVSIVSLFDWNKELVKIFIKKKGVK